ncbi:MAG TPA: tetratricopeptide repeat protein [Steroidobacteraceae bacterium]|nr:tetratricopeptide repeat protein [Steroidobacteraceae bacterium]
MQGRTVIDDLPKSPFSIGEWQVQPLRDVIIGAHGSVHLEPRCMEVLRCLAARPGHVVERKEIIDHVWAGSPAADEALTRCVSELRHIFGDQREHPQYIQTIPKRGYRLIAPVGSPQQAMPGGAPAQLVTGGAPTGLFAELQRRRVFRVGAAYAIVAWLLIQVAEATFAPLGLPAWAQTLVIVLALLGFPLALIMAWALEITPAGVVFDRSSNGRTRPVALDYAAAAAVLIGIGLVGYELLERDAAVLANGRSAAPEQSAKPVHAAPAAPANSIAVLAFQNLSDAAADAYLGDGIAEEVLTLLAKVPDLRVSARTASFYFKGKDVDLRSIASALGVAHILAGSVRRDAQRIRVTAELIETGTGFRRWSKTYDVAANDVPNIQHEITSSAVAALQIALSSDTEHSLVQHTTRDPEAYELYLQGREQLRRTLRKETLTAAERFFKAAIDRDPQFAAAFAGLCDTYLGMFENDRAAQFFQQAELACHRALTLDASYLMVNVSLGRLYLASGQHQKAEDEFRRALALNENYVDAHQGLAMSFERRDRLDEAEQHYRRAIAIDPGDWSAHKSLANFLYLQDRNAEAILEYKRVVTLIPDDPVAWNNLGSAYYVSEEFAAAEEAWARSIELGATRSALYNSGLMFYYQHRFEDAARMYERALELAPEDPRVWSNLALARANLPGQEEKASQALREAVRFGEARLAINPHDAETSSRLAYCYAALGDESASRAAIDSALRSGVNRSETHFFIALAWVSLGQHELALTALQQAVAHGFGAAIIAREPLFAKLRTDPRFKTLVAKI